MGGLAKYGLDYASLKEINPRLIYCSITGFGQTGPYAERPGYDFMIQAMGGMMSITGERDDLPGGGPQKAGVAVTDIVTGMYATVAVLAALQERHRSGLGQHLDIALLDSHVALLANQNSNYFNSGVAPSRAGNAHQNVVPYQVFAASDGHLIVATGNESQYRAYRAAIGRPDLGEDPRYATNRLRVLNRVALIDMLAAIMRQGRRDDWIAKLEAVGVPAAPSTTSRRRSRIRRRRPGSCAATCRIRPAASPPSPPAPCGSRPRRSRTAAPRRCWASTPRKCCATCWGSRRSDSRVHGGHRVEADSGRLARHGCHCVRTGAWRCAPPLSAYERWLAFWVTSAANFRSLARGSRPAGPDTLSAPSRRQLAPNTGADTLAISGSRSPIEI